jgi:hypothetical protein
MRHAAQKVNVSTSTVIIVIEVNNVNVMLLAPSSVTSTLPFEIIRVGSVTYKSIPCTVLLSSYIISQCFLVLAMKHLYSTLPSCGFDGFTHSNYQLV